MIRSGCDTKYTCFYWDSLDLMVGIIMGFFSLEFVTSLIFLFLLFRNFKGNYNLCICYMLHLKLKYI